MHTTLDRGAGSLHFFLYIERTWMGTGVGGMGRGQGAARGANGVEIIGCLYSVCSARIHQDAPRFRYAHMLIVVAFLVVNFVT